MGLKKVRKVPAGPKQVPTKGTRFARSSTKQPKPQGIQAGQEAAYGILHSSRFQGDGTGVSQQAIARANSLFGSGRVNGSNQGQLAKKAKRSF